MKYIDMPKPLVAINIDGAAGMIGAMSAYNSPNKGITSSSQPNGRCLTLSVVKQRLNFGTNLRLSVLLLTTLT